MYNHVAECSGDSPGKAEGEEAGSPAGNCKTGQAIVYLAGCGGGRGWGPASGPGGSLRCAVQYIYMLLRMDRGERGAEGGLSLRGGSRACAPYLSGACRNFTFCAIRTDLPGEGGLPASIPAPAGARTGGIRSPAGPSGCGVPSGARRQGRWPWRGSAP